MFSQRIKLFGGPFFLTTLRKNAILEIIPRYCLGLDLWIYEAATTSGLLFWLFFRVMLRQTLLRVLWESL